MKYAKTVDFTDFTIRPADGETDAEAINMIRLQPQVMKTTASLPSEEVEPTRRIINSDTNRFFVAETAQKPGWVVGYVVLRLSGDPMYKHTANLGIMIHSDYKRRGIGRGLMKKALDTAEGLGVKRIELEVDISNLPAVRLYESMGFKKEGVLRKTTVTYGEYVDDFLMSRLAPDLEGETGGGDIRGSACLEERDDNISRLGREEGRAVYTVRPVGIKDAAGLCRLYGESGSPKALDEAERDLKTCNPDIHRFVAIEAETHRLCGFAALHLSDVQRMRHCGSIHLLTERDRYWEEETGIAKSLMDAIIRLADDWLRLVRLEVVLISTDTRMISAYKKTGFEIEARKQKSVFFNGEYLDEYVMARVR